MLSREVLFRWLLALASFAVLIFFFSPPWGAFLIWARVPEMGGLIEVRRGVSVLWQVDHLGAAIPDKLHGAIQWRLLFPVIDRVLHLPTAVFFALSYVGCVVALAYIITILRRKGLGFFETVLAAVILGAVSWFFASVSWLGYFDSWLVWALLLVTFARERWPVWLACLWAPWVDERFVLAAPLAMLCRHLLLSAAAGDKAAGYDWKKEFTLPAGCIAAFLVIRLGVLPGHSGSNATVTGYLGSLKVLDTPWTRFAFGIWEGLRAGWFFVPLAVWLIWRQKRSYGWLWLGAGVCAVMAVSLVTAQDFSRSMMFVAPVALYGVVLAVESGWRWLPLALRGGAVAALLLPGHLVMNDGVNPILYLYHELAALDSPPPVIMSELHELKGIRALERWNFEEAANEMTMAIKLAADPSGPSMQRGIMYFNLGRWADARRDFSTAVEHDPENPEAWFYRAQAELDLHDGQAAVADMKKALSLAPPDWEKRPDVKNFLTQLGAK
jgi:hypothetical protein